MANDLAELQGAFEQRIGRMYTQMDERPRWRLRRKPSRGFVLGRVEVCRLPWFFTVQPMEMAGTDNAVNNSVFTAIRIRELGLIDQT
jgi:hypothetical protein